MKLLVIPDVHGRTFWRYALEHVNDYEKIIFLGDYLDPYEQLEHINFEMAEEQFKDIIAFREQYPDKVILLYGNHDIHYMVGHDLGCWRCAYWKCGQLKKIYDEIPLKLIYIVDNYLFSHAGVVQGWLNKNNLSLENLTNDSYEKLVNSLCDVGRSRGGRSDYGSCIWEDLYEFAYEDNKLEGYFQVFGHTQLKDGSIIVDKDFACLDGHRCVELDTETNEFKIINYVGTR